jgi:hypothetical protein
MRGRVVGCSSLAILAILFAAASCAPDKSSTGQERTNLSASKGTATAAGDDTPIPPKDAQYTIFCQLIQGPDHVERSRQLRQALRQSTSMKDWYVIHASEQSTLYYGFYRTMDPRDPADAKEGERAIHDLKTIRAMIDTNGMRPFSASLPVPIDSPDPAANPAWDLARTGGYWSVEIGIYKDNPRRKQAAVDAVRDARAAGIDAYYYHGPTSSSVCVGCWPREAVREVDAAAQNNDPDKPLLVTQTPLEGEMAQALEQKGVQAAAPQVEYVDPTVPDTLNRYPEHSVNGEVHTFIIRDPATGQKRTVPEHSRLVKIEQRETLQGEPSFVESGAPAAGARDNSAAPASGFGQLKGIGD